MSYRLKEKEKQHGLAKQYQNVHLEHQKDEHYDGPTSIIFGFGVGFVIGIISITHIMGLFFPSDALSTDVIAIISIVMVILLVANILVMRRKNE